MDRCALLAGFAVLAAVADQPDLLTVSFVEDQPAASCPEVVRQVRYAVG